MHSCGIIHNHRVKSYKLCYVMLSFGYKINYRHHILYCFFLFLNVNHRSISYIERTWQFHIITEHLRRKKPDKLNRDYDLSVGKLNYRNWKKYGDSFCIHSALYTTFTNKSITRVTSQLQLSYTYECR